MSEFTGKRNKRRVEERQIEAQVRQDFRDKLTPQQQLSELDNRLGTGVGATKEREKLQRMIESEVQSKVNQPSRSQKRHQKKS